MRNSIVALIFLATLTLGACTATQNTTPTVSPSPDVDTTEQPASPGVPEAPTEEKKEDDKPTSEAPETDKKVESEAQSNDGTVKIEGKVESSTQPEAAEAQEEPAAEKKPGY